MGLQHAAKDESVEQLLARFREVGQAHTGIAERESLAMINASV